MDAFLKESKRKLSAITDETKVHVVIGNEACDLDSAVSALVYAFYLYSLSKKQTTDESDVVYIPVLNIPRQDYPLRTEVTHCLTANQIADDTIVFRDDIDLRTLHEKSQLVLTLVDHNALVQSDAFMDDAIVEIVDHHSNGRHDSEDREIDINLEMVGSCGTLVTEKILIDSRQILDETTTTLLLSTILTDTFNLSETAQKTTPKDEAMVAELQQICPHIDRQQLFEGIEKVKFDVSGLSTTDLLRKDYKSVLGKSINIGMSSITLHLKDLLERPSLENDLQSFCTDKNLHILMLVNLALVDNETPQRQLGVYTSCFTALKDSLVKTVLETNSPALQLSEIKGSPITVAAFEQGNVAASRKKLMPIVQQFVESLESDPAHVKEFLDSKPKSDTVDLLGGDFMSGLDPLETSEMNPSSNQNNSNGDDPFGFGSLSSPGPTGTSVPIQNANNDDPFGLGLLDTVSHSTSSHDNAGQDVTGSAFLDIDPFASQNLEDSKTTGPGPPGLLDLDPFSSLETPASSAISSFEASLLPDFTNTNSALKPPSLLDLDPFGGMGDSASSSSNLESPSNPFETKPVTYDPEDPMTTSPSSPSSVPMGETGDILGLDPFAAPQLPNLTQGGTVSSNNPFQSTNVGDQNGNDLLGLGNFGDTSVPTNTVGNDGGQNNNDIFGLGDLQSTAPSEGNIANQNSNDIFDLGISGSLDNTKAESNSNKYSNDIFSLGVTSDLQRTNPDGTSQNNDNLLNMADLNSPSHVHAGVDLMAATMGSPILDPFSGGLVQASVEEVPSSSTSTLESESNLLSGFGTDPFSIGENTAGSADKNPFSSSNENTLSNPFGDSGISSQGGSAELLLIDSISSPSVTTDGDDESHLQESQQDIFENEQQVDLLEHPESQKVQDVQNWMEEIEAPSPTGEETDDIFFSNGDPITVASRAVKDTPKTPSNSISDMGDAFLSDLDGKSLDKEALSDKVEELHKSKLKSEVDDEAEVITVNGDFSHKPVFPREDSLSPLADERIASPSSETFSDDGSNSSSGESYTVNDYSHGPDQFAITQIKEAEEEDELSEVSKDLPVAEQKDEKVDEGRLQKEEVVDEEPEAHPVQDKLQDSEEVSTGLSELSDSTGQENIESELAQDNVETEGETFVPVQSQAISEDLAAGIQDYVNNVVEMSSFVYKQEMAEVLDTEETRVTDEDGTTTPVESEKPDGKPDEDVCDYVDTVVQMASFANKQEASEAEVEDVQSENVKETDNVEGSESGIINVEAQEEETTVVRSDEEQSNKDESILQDSNDVEPVIDNVEETKEKQIENAVVSEKAVDSEEPEEKTVEEVNDYVDTVVQMASFAYKQETNEAEVEDVQSSNVPKTDEVENSTSEIISVETPQEETNEANVIDEQSGEDGGIHQSMDNTERWDALVDVGNEASEEQNNLIATIEQSQSTMQEGSCEVTQAEEMEAGGEVEEPSCVELQNGDVTMATVLTKEEPSVCESEQSVHAEMGDNNELGEEKIGEAAESDIQDVNISSSEGDGKDFVEETVLLEEQSYAISQTESAKEQEESGGVVTEEIKSYVDSLVRMACFNHQEQMEADALKDLAGSQRVEEGIVESEAELESCVSPMEDIATEDVSAANTEEMISKSESTVTEVQIPAIKVDDSAISQVPSGGTFDSETQPESFIAPKEDITMETSASTEGVVTEEAILPMDNLISAVESVVTETAISPLEIAVTEAARISAEGGKEETVISTTESPITESAISPVEGSTTEAATPDVGELTPVDVNAAATDKISISDSPEKTVLAVEDSVQIMDASFDETLPSSSPPYKSTPVRPDTLSLSSTDSRGGKTKIHPVYTRPKNQAGTPASLLSEDGSIHSVTTLDAVSMFPITPSPGSLSDSDDDLSYDPTGRKQEGIEPQNNSPKRLVSVDSAMAEDIGGDWTGEAEILEAAAARQREKQLDSRQRSTPKLKEQGRQLSVASAEAKQRMEGVEIPEEWQDDEFSQQKLYGHDDTEYDSFYQRSVPKMDSITEEEKHRLRVDSDLLSRLRGDSDMSTGNSSLGASYTSDGKQRLRVDSDLQRLRGDSSMSERSQELGKDRGREDSDVSDATLDKFVSSLRRMSEDSLEDDLEYLQEEGDLDISDDDEDDTDLGARPKKRIPADLDLDGVDQIDGKRVSQSTNGATPAVLTPTSTEMSWDDDGGTGQPKESIPEYSAKEEMEDKKNWRRVMIGGKEHAVDMRAINPYKKVLSHGGYYGDGLNAIIVFASCYMPDKSRKDYNYVMHNLFLYVVSTLELLVAQDYMIIYFHGAAPKSRIPSLGWMRKCYKMIDRKLRKNLKGLYLVHPTTWLKTVVRLTRPFVSSKFSNKLKFIYSLEELEKLVPMDFVYVPDEVRRHDERIKRKENASHWWGWLGYTNTLSDDDDFEETCDGSELSSIDDLDDLLFPQLPPERRRYNTGESDFASSPHSTTSDDVIGVYRPEMESEDSGCSDHEDIHIDGVEGGGFMEDDIFAYSSGNVTPVNKMPRPLFMNARRQQSREGNRTPTNE